MKLGFISIPLALALAVSLLYTLKPATDKPAAVTSVSLKTAATTHNDWHHRLKSTQKTAPVYLTLDKYDKEAVAPGFILLPTSGSELIQLIDHEMNILHSWNIDAERARLLENCNVLVVMGTRWGESRAPWQELKKSVVELDQSSAVVWSYNTDNLLHHDIQRLSNGNTLLIKRDVVSQNLRNQEYRDLKRWNGIAADVVREINTHGDTVWQWNSSKHLDINSCGRRKCVFHKTKKARRKPKPQDWTHLNTASVIPENHWYREGHTAFEPGNVMIVPRNFWEAMIISRSTGEVLWRYGEGLIYGHEAHMIEPGLKGAGNILIFDNGGSGSAYKRPYSIVKEVNPVTKETVWSYSDPKNFFSPSGGSMQRLSNGNTLISGDNGGLVFEVTQAGEVVWSMKSNLRVNRARKYNNACLHSFAKKSAGSTL